MTTPVTRPLKIALLKALKDKQVDLSDEAFKPLIEAFREQYPQIVYEFNEVVDNPPNENVTPKNQI